MKNEELVIRVRKGKTSNENDILAQDSQNNISWIQVGDSF